MTVTTASPLFLGEAWFDPIETGIRERIRGFIEALVEEELSNPLGRTRYQRPGCPGSTRGSAGTAAEKIEAFEAAGVAVAKRPIDFVDLIRARLN